MWSELWLCHCVAFSVFFKPLFFGKKCQWSIVPQDFSVLCYIHISFYLSISCGSLMSRHDPGCHYAVCVILWSSVNQHLSLVCSPFLVKSHWKPNLELASWELQRKCCILQSISNTFNTLCGRSVAAKRFTAAFVQLSMHSIAVILSDNVLLWILTKNC